VLSTKGVTNLELGDYLGECSRRTEQRRARLGLDGRSGGLPCSEGQAESWRGERPTDAYNTGDTSHFSSVFGAVAFVRSSLSPIYCHTCQIIYIDFNHTCEVCHLAAPLASDTSGSSRSVRAQGP
jgi:hypothetical protein